MVGFTIPGWEMVEIIPERVEEVAVIRKEDAAEEGGGAAEVVLQDFAKERVFGVVGQWVPLPGIVIWDPGSRMQDAG